MGSRAEEIKNILSKSQKPERSNSSRASEIRSILGKSSQMQPNRMKQYIEENTPSGFMENLVRPGARGLVKGAVDLPENLLNI